MNYGEFTRLLKKAGWHLDREAKGSHKIWMHDATGSRIAVPDHGSKEIKPSLLNGLMRQAGLK